MSDIIQRTKKALEGTTPGPWKISGEFDPEYPELHGAPQEKGSFVYTPILCENVLAHLLPRDVELITAAPELAQALAEETYFYGVQVWMGGRWIMMLTSNYGTSLMHRGKWFERKDEAEECAAKWNHDTPTRIVRQRRSPVEVINE